MKALSNGGESTSSKLQEILDENATVTIHYQTTHHLQLLSIDTAHRSASHCWNSAALTSKISMAYFKWICLFLKVLFCGMRTKRLWQSRALLLLSDERVVVNNYCRWKVKVGSSIGSLASYCAVQYSVHATYRYLLYQVHTHTQKSVPGTVPR
jgi:hypothetical protein